MKTAPIVMMSSLLMASLATAQEVASVNHSPDDIAQKLADPGAALVSVPLQYSYLGDVGNDEHNQQLKLQPMIPFVGERGKFLLRPILPYQWNESPLHTQGTGDLFVQGYFIPTTHGRPSPTEFGFGFAAMFDSANHDSLGTGKYSLGPALVLVHKRGKWTMGGLLNHVWSIGGDDSRADVSNTSMQPFLSRSLRDGWSFTLSSESAYNWKANGGEQWTVPLGGSISKVLRIGKQPLSIGVGYYYNVERPELTNRWSARFTVTLVFPA